MASVQYNIERMRFPQTKPRMQVCGFAEGQQALADARQYASEIVAKQLSNRRQRGALADKDENGLLKVQKASIESLMDFAVSFYRTSGKMPLPRRQQRLYSALPCDRK